MNSFKRFGVICLLGCMALMSACGAKQSSKKVLQAEWNDLYGAAPANAAWTVGARLQSDGLNPLLEQVTALGGGGYGDTDIFRPLQSAGLLLDAEIVSFAHEGSVWQIVRLENIAEAMELLGDHLRMTNPALEETRHGERVVLRSPSVYEETSGQVVTAFDGYIVSRVGDITDDEAVAAEFKELAAGWPTVGSYAHTGHGAAQRARVANNKLNYWGGIDIAALNQEFVRDAERYGLSADEQPDFCREAAERVTSAVPSLAVVRYENEDGQKFLDGFMALSPRSLERGRSVMRGAPSVEGLVEHALLGLSGSLDYNAFLQGLQATPEWKDCPGMPALVGLLAEVYESRRNDITFNSRTVSGTGALVVQSVSLAGFVPTGELAVAVHSGNPVALLDRLTRFGSRNGTTSVIADASSPAVQIVIPSMMLSLRVQTAEDRVVIGTSGILDDVWSKLMQVPMHTENAPALELVIDGPRMSEAVKEANDYVSEIFADQMPEEFVAPLEALGTDVPSTRSTLRFEGGGLRFFMEER